MESPFQITVYDKNFTRLGWVDAPISQSYTVRHNQQSSGAIIVPTGSDQDILLGGMGNRVVVNFRDEFLISGPVRSYRTAGPGGKRLTTYQVQDDFRLINRILLWPLPASDIWAQTKEHDRRTGPAETVLRDFLAANVARLEEPVTVPASLGRGATVTYNARFQTAGEDLLAMLDQAGVGVRVRQSGSGLAVEFYTSPSWPITLSEDNGTVVDMEWELEGPTCTRVVIGGAFEGIQREFYTLENPVLEEQWSDVIETFVDGGSVSSDYRAAFEDLKRARERVEDARDDYRDELKDLSKAAKERDKAAQGVKAATKARARAEAIKNANPSSSKALSAYNKAVSAVTTANNALTSKTTAYNNAKTALSSAGTTVAERIAEMEEAHDVLLDAYDQYRDDLYALGEAELAKGQAHAGFALTLQEGEVFRYGGEGVHVGDLIPVEVSPGVQVVDVLRSCTLSLSVSGQFTVTPVVGDGVTTPTTKLSKLVGSAISGPNKVRTR
jgi:tetratricopeptide (TPR) repeat protein